MKDASMNDRYRVLVLTSLPDLADEVMTVVRRHFRHPQLICWEMGNRRTPIADIRAWFATLDPAHVERVFLNHPRAIIHPPCLADL
jgi:hypothetical protein